jgi:hypothetical protein
MQLCFAQLANWPLYLVLVAIYFDPTKYMWTLQKTLGDNSSLGFYLLDGRLANMLIFFLVFFFIEWILRKEFLLIAIIFYFLVKSDLHVHLALAAILGIYISRCTYLWWFYVDLESLTRKIWKTTTLIQLGAIFFVSIGSLYGLDFLQQNRYFSATSAENRFEFLLGVIFSFHLITQLILVVWGHFSLQKKSDPSFLPVYYSTTTWILRFKMSFLLKNNLKDVVAKVLQSHLKSYEQMKEIKDLGLGVKVSSIEETLNKEIVFLQLASSRLTVD